MANTELVVTNWKRYFQVVAESPLDIIGLVCSSSQDKSILGINRKYTKNKIKVFMLLLQNLIRNFSLGVFSTDSHLMSGKSTA